MAPPRKFSDTPEGRRQRAEAQRASNRRAFLKRQVAKREARPVLQNAEQLQQQAYRAQDRERYRAAERLRKFGVAEHEYNEMVAVQGNCCAICRQKETAMRLGKVRALAVDHDHETGKVRALLCSDCNVGIGKLKEDREILLAAIRYLDSHNGVENVTPLRVEGPKG